MSVEAAAKVRTRQPRLAGRQDGSARVCFSGAGCKARVVRRLLQIPGELSARSRATGAQARTRHGYDVPAWYRKDSAEPRPAGPTSLPRRCHFLPSLVLLILLMYRFVPLLQGYETSHSHRGMCASSAASKVLVMRVHATLLGTRGLAGKAVTPWSGPDSRRSFLSAARVREQRQWQQP